MITARIPKAFFICALALLVPPALTDQQPAHAEVDGTVAIGCEFLGRYVDGYPNDETMVWDFIESCDGIDAADVSAIADALGDRDGTLEVSDFAAIDVDANQLQADGVLNYKAYIFAIVDNDAATRFDADSGLSIEVNDDGLDPEGTDDLDTETCGDGEGLDRDCDTSAGDDGDGVVVATVRVTTADPADYVDIVVDQADDPSTEFTETIHVVGPPASISVEALKPTIGATELPAAFEDCLEESNVLDLASIASPMRTVLKATLRDAHGTAMTRVHARWTAVDPEVADIDDDSSTPGGGFETAAHPKADTGISIDSGPGGIAQFALACGGMPGVATFEAEESNSGLTASVQVTVVPGECARADVNGDGRIDVLDMHMVGRFGWHRRHGGGIDVNGDGRYNVLDLHAVVTARRACEA